mgnify:CR=1 FL=1
MGTSITLHVEVLVESTGKWVNYARYNPARYYRAFYQMAGIRGPYEDLTPRVPKGLPEDRSELVRIAFGADLDAHKPSWLSSDEIEDLRGCLDAAYDNDDTDLGWDLWLAGARRSSQMVYAYLFNNGWHKRSLPDGLSDFRFVFWFDGE